MRTLSILAVAVFLAQGAFASPLAQSYRTIKKSVTAPDGGAFQTQAMQHRDALMRLLGDQDPKVRITALKALKAYVTQTSRVRDAVLRVYERDNELAVRYQAAKTLLFVAGYNRVESSLLDTARYGSDPELRAISVKALYSQAAGSSRVRSRVMDLARYESDKTVRAGALWALFAASGDSRVRDLLVNTAERESDTGIRVEALRSLYNGMGHSRVRDRVARIAMNTGEPAAVRKPAILLLSAVTSSRTRDWLQRIASREADSELRRAAILAMDPGNTEILDYFHLVRRDQNGRVIDPLDRE
jgi:HEAT repeat protein